MTVYNKRKTEDVDVELLWAEKMKKNPSLKRLNPPGSAADIMQAIEYDWDLHFKKKQAESGAGDDPWRAARAGSRSTEASRRRRRGPRRRRGRRVVPLGGAAGGGRRGNCRGSIFQ